jgi:hypothetical protein
MRDVCMHCAFVPGLVACMPSTLTGESAAGKDYGNMSHQLLLVFFIDDNIIPDQLGPIWNW